jgi:hypothetical protein
LPELADESATDHLLSVAVEQSISSETSGRWALRANPEIAVHQGAKAVLRVKPPATIFEGRKTMTTTVVAVSIDLDK